MLRFCRVIRGVVRPSIKIESRSNIICSLNSLSNSSKPPKNQLFTQILHTQRHQTTTTPQASVTFQHPTLIGTDPWGLWAALTLAGCAGLWAERTKWGKEMSGALLSTLIGLAISNLRVIPAESPLVYGAVTGYLLPLAVPLLLFAADFRKIFTLTGRLLPAFILGAVSTVIGSLVAFSALPLQSLGTQGWKVAAALTARHIGGSVNYVAVSEQLSLSPAARMAGLAADDLIVSLYFIALYSLVRRVPPDTTISSASTSSSSVEEEEEEEDRRKVTVLHGATALALSTLLCYLGTSIARYIGYKGGSITVITALTVMLATAFPERLKPLVSSGEGLAAILMQIFFAAVGASGSFAAVLATAPALFVWSLIAISVHLGLVVVVGEKVLGFSLREVALASNACIGGPTTAAGMAQSKGWRSSLVPALLIGIFGYSTATFIGVGMSGVFRSMQAAALAA